MTDLTNQWYQAIRISPDHSDEESANTNRSSISSIVRWLSKSSDKISILYSPDKQSWRIIRIYYKCTYFFRNISVFHIAYLFVLYNVCIGNLVPILHVRKLCPLILLYQRFPRYCKNLLSCEYKLIFHNNKYHYTFELVLVEKMVTFGECEGTFKIINHSFINMLSRLKYVHVEKLRLNQNNKTFIYFFMNNLT